MYRKNKQLKYYQIAIGYVVYKREHGNKTQRTHNYYIILRWYYVALTTAVYEYYYQMVLSNPMRKIESQSIWIMDSERIYEYSDVDSNSVYSSSDDLESAPTKFNLAAYANKIYKQAQVIF